MNYRDICDLREGFNNISVANVETLRTINKKLKILEKQIKKESFPIDQHLMEKVKDNVMMTKQLFDYLYKTCW